jgi:hypothetical protein
MKKADFIFINQVQRPFLGPVLLFVTALFIFSCVVSRPVVERTQAFYIRPVPGANTEDVTMEGEVKSTIADTIFMVYLGWNKGKDPVIDTVWVNGKAFRAIIQKVLDENHFIGTKRSTGDSIFLTTSDGISSYFRLDLAPIEGESNNGKSGIIIRGLNRGKPFEMYIGQMTELSPGIRM